MQQLVYEVRQLCRHNRDGSYVTQANREAMLCQMAEQLITAGYKQLHAGELKGRHVHKLFALWREGGLTDQTIRNRLSILRWWCEKVGRPSIMPRTNAVYHLTPRPGAAVRSKAVELGEEILGQIEDAYVQMSLRLQQQWGLRREESLKIRVWQADRGDHLVLQGSWTKGGRPREIPVSWPAQRAVLEQAKQLVRFKSHSLIPHGLKYYQQRNRYDAVAQQLGVPPLHGLRHCFAQRRYAMLAGFPCPLQGGPPRATLTPEERARDQAARRQVSAELGHGRISIVGMYCGL